MSSIKYVVEIAERVAYPPELAISSSYYDDPDIYTFAIGHPSVDTYWSDWGGTYDNPETTDIQLFFSQLLTQVYSETELLAADYTFYARDSSTVDIHLPQKPWQYLTAQTRLMEERHYASAPKDATNPQDITYTDDNGTRVKYPVRLAVPSLSLKLSDSVSGETRRGTFTVQLYNDDGLFDNISKDNFFNAPITIKRTSVEVPTRDDYKTIRQGLVDYVKNTGTQLKITSAEYLRLFSDDVCNTFTLEDYPNIDEDLVDTTIPIGYGELIDVPLIQLDTYDYLGIDQSYATSVQAVYDEDGNEIDFTYVNGIIRVAGTITQVLDGDGNSINFTYPYTVLVDSRTEDVSAVYNSEGTSLDFSYSNGAITITDPQDAGTISSVLDGDSNSISFSVVYDDDIDSITVDDETTSISSVTDADGIEANFSYSSGTITITEPSTCDMTGLTDDTIGAIITNEIASKSAVSYTASNWDTDETDEYISESASIGYYYNSDGDVSDLVEDVLKNDSAFLLTKNDGRLTLRQWGRTYAVHRIPSHMIMSIPSIDTQSSKDLHMTKVKVKYGYEEDAGDYASSYLNTNRQLELIKRYSKSELETYETRLKSEADAESFSDLLLARFGIVPEILDVDLGYDCSDINLLDTVVLDVKVNDRQMSEKLFWTVTQTNPAQDNLTMWSDETVGAIDFGLFGNDNIVNGFDEDSAHGYN